MCSYWSEIGPIFSTIKKCKCAWVWILILSYTYEIKLLSPVPFPPDRSASVLSEHSLKFSCFLFNAVLINGTHMSPKYLWTSKSLKCSVIFLLLLFYCQKIEGMRGEVVSHGFFFSPCPLLLLSHVSSSLSPSHHFSY